jgi:hypothetical protein
MFNLIKFFIIAMCFVVNPILLFIYPDIAIISYLIIFVFLEFFYPLFLEDYL